MRAIREKTICPFQASVVALAISMAFPAWAQEPKAADADAAAESGAALQSIIIKARGRDETQQSVPLSVKAFSAKAIVDIGIKRPSDFVAVTPNLSLMEAQSVGNSFMTIRGLTQVRNGEAPMAVVVDGVIQSTPSQFAQELFDIQSIEVLRGPQGALYGRNASGGAILINTRQPQNKTGGYLQMGIGNGGHKQVQGSVGGAIVPNTLLYRLSGSYIDRNGYYGNEVTGQKVDHYQDTTLRGLLRWNVNHDLSIDLRLNHVRDKSGALNYQYQPTHLNADCTADPNNLFDLSRINADHVSTRYCANNATINKRSLDEITTRFSYNLQFATLTGLASFNRDTEGVVGDQFPYTASRGLLGGTIDGTAAQYIDTKTQTWELRLTSPSKPGVRWMGGVYGLKTERFVSSVVGADLGRGIVLPGRDPVFFSPINPTLSWFADNNRNQATAVFGNVDWDITPQVELSTALRYDRDQRKQIVDSRQSLGLPAGCTAANTARCIREATFSALQPKVSLRYKSDQGGLIYGSWGKGFRSGQFNQSGVSAAAASAGINGVADQIGAENTTTAELGYKTTLLGGKLFLNTALFDTKVTNAPYFVFIGATTAQVQVGIDRISLRGGEFEAVANLAPGLDGSVGVGYTQSKITAYSLNPNLVGNQSPYVPKVTANVGLQYRFPISSGLRMMVRGDVLSKSKQYWDPENSSPRSTLNLVNLRLALEDAANKWALALAVQNLSNKRYNAEFVAGGFVQAAPPRSIRMDLRYNF